MRADTKLHGRSLVQLWLRSFLWRLVWRNNPVFKQSMNHFLENGLQLSYTNKLHQNSFPDPTGFVAFNSHFLCLDTLLLFIGHMVERINSEVRIFIHRNICISQRWMQLLHKESWSSRWTGNRVSKVSVHIYIHTENLFSTVDFQQRITGKKSKEEIDSGRRDVVQWESQEGYQVFDR